jgi:hypothetical protein
MLISFQTQDFKATLLVSSKAKDIMQVNRNPTPIPVTVSIIAYGVSAVPLAKWYRRRMDEQQGLV